VRHEVKERRGQSIVDNVHYGASTGADQGAFAGVSAEGSYSCADQPTGNRCTCADRDEAQRENCESEESSHRCSPFQIGV
jgi:hypothetical protein